MAWSLRGQQVREQMVADQVVAVIELTTEQTLSDIYKLSQNFLALSNAVSKAFTGNKEKN